MVVVSANGAYNEDSIVALSDLEHVRHRASGYIPDTAIQGQFHISKEIIDNGADELALAQSGGSLEVFLFKNPDRSNYQIIVHDNGRGIPVGKLVDVFANTKTSGKFSTSSYAFSCGSYGIGSSVTLALSNWFRAITLNQDVIGDATIHYSNIPKAVETITNHTGRTGTVVMYEPDSTIFSEIAEFINDHSKLTEYLIQLSLYGTFRIRLFVSEDGIPEEVRTSSTAQVLEYIDEISKSEAFYDSLTLDRDRYVRGFFGIQKKWDATFHIEGRNSDDTLRVDADIMVTLNANVNPANNKLTFVNNILFVDNASLHINMLYKFLADKISVLITDKNIKKFFDEHYKLPIWVMMDVKFAGAQFSGMAKTSFRDVSFRDGYQKLLSKIVPPEVIASLYESIVDHIALSYDRFSNSDFKPNSMKNLLARLNRPDKFNNCSTTERDRAELFLVEGDSAGGNQDRKSDFQAIYTLGGKPFNGLTTIDKLMESANNIKKNAVFQDILRILNLTPGATNLNGLNFGKVLIMADADTHGYHITNIVLGNLYALCPALIEEGRVYVTIPPLYSLKLKGNSPIYIRNSDELNITMACQVYHRCLKVAIESSKYKKELTRDEFAVFSNLIIKIGDELRRLSDEYMIPALLLEQLSLITAHLTTKRPNVEAIKLALGYDVKYVESSNMLIVSIGMDDIIVPLNQITDLIYARILPMYREFFYGRTRLYVTTKNSDVLNDTPTTIVQLHEIFKQLDKMFTISRFKGLGSMPPADRAANCTNPATRRVHRITGIGDIDKVFQMLGSDASHRKELMTA